MALAGGPLIVGPGMGTAGPQAAILARIGRRFELASRSKTGAVFKGSPMTVLTRSPLSAMPPATSRRFRLSIVAPMYNEAANVERFVQAVRDVLRGLTNDYEIICVNDGSHDDTLEQLRVQRRLDAAVKIVDLSRNFGKDIALSAGLDHAVGDAVICIDADLQHPVELIPEMVKQWQNGYDVVVAFIRSRAAESLLRRWLTRRFYGIFNRLSEVPMPPHGGDFRLLDQRVAAVFRLMPEKTRFMKGLFAWVGFRQLAIPYQPRPRVAGTSSWSLWRLWHFGVDGIVAFTTMPLRIWSYFGILVSLVALLYGSLIIFQTLVHGVDVPGYASLMVVLLFFGGVQLISLGIIGEYLGRVYREVKGRPLYVINQAEGFGSDEVEPRSVRLAETGSQR
jgi:polyisoprenyl-phosphate glycosyltransferase